MPHNLIFSFDRTKDLCRNPGRALLILIFLLSALALQTEARAGELGSRPASLVSTTQEGIPLEMGKGIAGEFAGGQKHTYQITLAAGQYAGVIVEQRGMDVVVQLLETDGKVSVEYDDEIATHGAEQVNLVADVAGSYRFAIEARFKGVPAGSYEIRWTEVRTATEKDRLLHEADRLKTEATRVGRAGKYDEALPLAEKSLAIRERELGSEHLDVANSLYNVAGILLAKGNYKNAEPLYQRAVAIAEKLWGLIIRSCLFTLAVLAGSTLTQGTTLVPRRSCNARFKFRKRLWGSIPKLVPHLTG